MDRDAPSVSPQPIRRADYAPPAYRIDAVELLVSLDDAETVVRATLTGRRNQDAAPGPLPLVLDGQDQELVSVTLNGQDLPRETWVLEPEKLSLPPVDGAFELVIDSRIKPQNNTSLEGLYLSNGMYCTQCEAEGFRKITYFPDRPDVMAVYTVRIEADRQRFPVLLSNGNPIDAGDLPDGRHFAVWHDPFPKPSYLFAMVAGDLACAEGRFVTASGREVALRIFVEHGNEGRTGHAMQALKRSMRWDEEVYGFEYDLDIFMIVAVSHFNMGAMENKGLNIFNDKYILADVNTASDVDFQRIEGIVAHEYFHNWTGNRITCRDWFQLSLKEGLTVFRDQEFSADVHDRGVKRVGDVRLLRAAQFPEDAGPTAHPVRPDSYIEINNFYTVTIYEKGAEVVRMIHTLLGPDGFRRGMDLYIERHDGHAVTCEDFVTAMEDANSADLSRFRGWYAQAGTPRVTARWSHDSVAGTLILDLEQVTPPTPGQPRKQAIPIPMRLALISQDRARQPLMIAGDNTSGQGENERVIVLDEDRRRVVFEGVTAGAVPSLLRGFSAPVILDAGWSADELAFLAGVDDDPFGRWEALQTLSTRALLIMVDAILAGKPAALDNRVVEAFRASLADDRLEPSFLAELLTLPGESVLGQAMDIWHVDAVHQARKDALRTLGQTLSEPLASLYARLTAENADNKDLSTAAMGRRALKNRALAYLVATEDAAGVARAASQAATGASMTDVMGALVALNDTDRPEREAALRVFHDRWVDNPIVLDKWFGLEAGSARPGALNRVKELLDHPGFDRRNPNRVRALIGGFTMGNPVRFHAADGSGYVFLADQVLALDPVNPQVAARLVQPLVRWRKFDEGRRRAMTDALRRVVEQPTLSKDVYEIASKALSE